MHFRQTQWNGKHISVRYKKKKQHTDDPKGETVYTVFKFEKCIEQKHTISRYFIKILLSLFNN